MRFEQLVIEKYGAIDERTVEFGQTPGLVVIYGPNEAGKSTSLAAISDFLFGVQERTTRASLFGGDAIRLTGSLLCEDRSPLALRRRKGRVRTLTDLEGAPVDEAPLSKLLAGTSRERFETLFGLDHERLRSGGDQLLAANGEVGRLIVEAGGGLRALLQGLERIDAQIETLFGPRKKQGVAFYQVLETYEAADRKAKDGSVSIDQYQRAQSEDEEAKQHLRRLQQEQGAILAEASTLDRIIRVVPLLRGLDQLREGLEAFTDLSLPEDFDGLVQGALQARREALDSVSSAAERTKDVEDQLGALPPQSLIADLEKDIRDVAAQAPLVAKAREDMGNRQKELAEFNAKLDGLRHRLGLSRDDELASRLPTPGAIALVGSLAEQGQRIGHELTTAKSTAAALGESVNALTEKAADFVSKGQHEAVGIKVQDLAALPPAFQAVSNLEHTSEAKLQSALSRAKKLGFDSLEALRATTFPSAEALRDEVKQRERLAADRLSQGEKRSEAEALRDSNESAIKRLTAGPGVATDTALLEARKIRTDALDPLRQAHLAGKWQASASDRMAEVEAADQSVDHADQIADRHAREAQRAAELNQASKQFETATANVAAAERMIKSLGDELAARESAFNAAFPDVLVRYPQLPALDIVIAERNAILKLDEEALDALTSAQAERVRLATDIEILSLAERACGLTPAAETTITERVRAAMNAISGRDEAHSTYKRDRQALEEAESNLKVAQTQLGDLVKEEADWRKNWSTGVVALGLDPETSLGEAAAGALEWAAAQGILAGIESTQRRIERMQEDESKLNEEVLAIGAKLHLALPSDPVAAANMLHERWKEHDEHRRTRDQLKQELTIATQALARQKDRLTDCEAVVGDLCTQAGIAIGDTTQLDHVRERHQKRKELTARLSAISENLLTAGDGLPEEVLREAWANKDLDGLVAEKSEKSVRANEIAQELIVAIEKSVASRTAMESYLDQNGINSAVVERESAIAELHDIIERYVELSIARDIINDAVEEIRSSQQDPLIVRAGGLFEQMTQGAYKAVGADIDDKGTPIVQGINAADRRVGVHEMSDGTRDQLYLAFRLAGVESYCKSAEPLPFVADDILVHFDDPRSEATLGVLADFSATTQVLLFTHHLNVKHAAEKLAAAGRARVVELS